MPRDEKTGRYISTNPDPMTKMMIERRQNTRGMRVLRKLIEIDVQERQARGEQ